MDINNSPQLTALPKDLFGDLTIGAFRIRNTGMTEVPADMVGFPADDHLKQYYIKSNELLLTLNGDTVSFNYTHNATKKIFNL